MLKTEKNLQHIIPSEHMLIPDEHDVYLLSKATLSGRESSWEPGWEPRRKLSAPSALFVISDEPTRRKSVVYSTVAKATPERVRRSNAQILCLNCIFL